MNLLKRRNTLTPLLGLYARRDSLQDCEEDIDPILFSESKSSRRNEPGHQNQQLQLSTSLIITRKKEISMFGTPEILWDLMVNDN